MLRITLRECLLLTACAALCVTLGIRQFPRAPVYLHVYGTNVSDAYFRSIADLQLTNYLGVRWDLATSIDIHPGLPFGVRAPNRRQPFIDVRGVVLANWNHSYRTRISFELDDSNFTYIQTDEIDVQLHQLVYIDKSDYCYTLSNHSDPEVALAKALRPTRIRSE
jgi:hypothetical protein